MNHFSVVTQRILRKMKKGQIFILFRMDFEGYIFWGSKIFEGGWRRTTIVVEAWLLSVLGLPARAGRLVVATAVATMRLAGMGLTCSGTANVAGVIGSAIAAGVMISMVS